MCVRALVRAFVLAYASNSGKTGDSDKRLGQATRTSDSDTRLRHATQTRDSEKRLRQTSTQASGTEGRRAARRSEKRPVARAPAGPTPDAEQSESPGRPRPSHRPGPF